MSGTKECTCMPPSLGYFCNLSWQIDAQESSSQTHEHTFHYKTLKNQETTLLWRFWSNQTPQGCMFVSASGYIYPTSHVLKCDVFICWFTELSYCFLHAVKCANALPKDSSIVEPPNHFSLHARMTLDSIAKHIDPWVSTHALFQQNVGTPQVPTKERTRHYCRSSKLLANPKMPSMHLIRRCIRWSHARHNMQCSRSINRGSLRAMRSPCCIQTCAPPVLKDHICTWSISQSHQQHKCSNLDWIICTYIPNCLSSKPASRNNGKLYCC